MKLKLITCIMVLMLVRCAFGSVKDLSKSDWSKILTEINAVPKESLLDKYVHSADTLDKVNDQTKGSLKTDDWIKIFKKLNLEPKPDMKTDEWALFFNKIGINLKSAPATTQDQAQQKQPQPELKVTATPPQYQVVASTPIASIPQNTAIIAPKSSTTTIVNELQKNQDQPNKPVKISLDLKGMDILSVLKMISQKTEINIIAGNNVKGNVNIYLKEIDALDALKMILEMNDLAYVYENKVIKVLTAQDYEKVYGKKFYDRTTVEIVNLSFGKAENILKTLTPVKSKICQIIADNASNSLIIIDTPDNIADLKKIIDTLDVKIETKVFRLNYAKVKEISDKIKPSLSPNISEIQIDERGNQLIITDSSRKMDDISKLISSLDKKHREVLIEAKIVQLTHNNTTATGISWNSVFNGINNNLAMPGQVVGNLSNLANPQTISVGGGNGVQLSVGTLAMNNFNAVLDMLQTIGKTDLVSSPRIAAIENIEAKILVGTKQAYVTTTVTNPGSTTANSVVAESVNFIDVGMKLFVTPTISDDGYITMKIRPEVSSVDSYLTTAQNNTIPIVRTSESETTVMVKDGVTIVIAGLMEVQEIKKTEGLPLLSEIPVIGALFSRKSTEKDKTELIVFITPRVMTGDVVSDEYINGNKPEEYIKAKTFK